MLTARKGGQAVLSRGLAVHEEEAAATPPAPGVPPIAPGVAASDEPAGAGGGEGRG
jgi:hypothetical protein